MADAALLLRMAQEARSFAYAPYSGCTVGAALVGASGTIYTGCNIENAAYSPTNCAERTALFKAVSQGERRFTALAVAGGKGEPFPPCGVCRQVLAEFCGLDMPIYLGSPEQIKTLTLGDLLPYAFDKDYLPEDAQ